MSTSPEATIVPNYVPHLQHLKLKGLQANTLEACSRAIRLIGKRFDHRIDAPSQTKRHRRQLPPDLQDLGAQARPTLEQIPEPTQQGGMTSLASMLFEAEQEQ